MPALDPYFKALRDSHAESLLLRAGEPPVWRVAGSLVPNGDPLPPASEFEDLLLDLATANGLVDRYREAATMEFTHETDGFRSRIQIVRDANGRSAVVRRAPARSDAAALGLPPALLDAPNLRHGLVLLSGAPGAGRTTTLAALVDAVNNGHSRYLVVVDRTAEFTYESNRSMVHQLMVGVHTPTLAAGIDTALQAGADVIAVTDIDSRETAGAIARALDAGALVLTAMAAHGVTDVLDRLLRLLPREACGYERSCIADGFAIAAHLQLATTHEDERIPLIEMAEASAEIRALMREDRIDELEERFGDPRVEGLRCLEVALAERVREGLLTQEEAIHYARRRQRLERELVSAV